MGTCAYAPGGWCDDLGCVPGCKGKPAILEEAMAAYRAWLATDDGKAVASFYPKEPTMRACWFAGYRAAKLA